MKIDRLFNIFIVKEKKFFPLFKKQSSIINEAAKLLLDLFKQDDYEKRMTIYKEIKSKENECDYITEQIYEELNKTFVTPFDREDIHNLASKTDTFLDLIHDAARKQMMYSPVFIYPEIISIANHVYNLSLLIDEIMIDLENIPKSNLYLLNRCNKIKKIEHEVDELYENFICNLFKNELNAIELIKSKNIVQALEDSTDKAKDMSDAVRTIILKHA